MSVKDLLFSNFKNLDNLELPPWLNEEIIDNKSSIKSYSWKANKIRKIRLCELNINNNFFAESLVIYPEFEYETPIFGTEYINCSDKKFFGTIDFHPLKPDLDYKKKYIEKYLSDLPNRKKNNSKVYDLNKYFSNKLWLKTDKNSFYVEYLSNLENYIEKYKVCLEESKQTSSNYLHHKGYDYHLSSTDPAYGILKAHYSKEFAEKYIYNFLFDLH